MAKRNLTPILLLGAAAVCAAYLLYDYTPIGMWVKDNFLRPKPSADEMSRLFVYYNERDLEGNVDTDSGCQMRTIGKALTKYGICSAPLYPYTPSTFATKPSDAAYTEGLVNKISSYAAVGSLDEIKQMIAFEHKPVMIGINIYKSFESDEVAKTGILPLPQVGEEILGGHAVLVVGYDDDKNWLIVRNSWGDKWGSGGYFFLPYDYFNDERVFDGWIINK